MNGAGSTCYGFRLRAWCTSRDSYPGCATTSVDRAERARRAIPATGAVLGTSAENIQSAATVAVGRLIAEARHCGIAEWGEKRGAASAVSVWTYRCNTHAALANHSSRAADATTRLLSRAARIAVETHLPRRAARRATTCLSNRAAGSATDLAGRTTGRAVEAGAIAAGIVAVDRPGRAAQAIDAQPGYAHGAAHATVFGIGPGVHALTMAERETGRTVPCPGEDAIEPAESKHAPKGARCKGLDRLATRGGCRQRFGELVKFGGIHLHLLLC